MQQKNQKNPQSSDIGIIFLTDARTLQQGIDHTTHKCQQQNDCWCKTGSTTVHLLPYGHHQPSVQPHSK